MRQWVLLCWTNVFVAANPLLTFEMSRRLRLIEKPDGSEGPDGPTNLPECARR